MTFRKKSRFLGFNTKDSLDGKVEVLVNGKRLNSYKVLNEQLNDLKGYLTPKTYRINLKGGGRISQDELVSKVLYKYLKKENLSSFKAIHPFVDRTDVRRSYPKLYGGPKARTRSQKSYR